MYSGMTRMIHWKVIDSSVMLLVYAPIETGDFVLERYQM